MADLTAVEVFTAPCTGPGTGVVKTSADMRSHLQAAANRSEWNHARMADINGVEQVVTTVDGLSFLHVAAHGYVDTDPVRVFSVGGSVPTGLNAGNVYYVRDKTDDTFKLAATSGGSAISITSSGTGTVYVASVVDGAGKIFVLGAGNLSDGSLRAQLSELDENRDLAPVATNLGIADPTAFSTIETVTSTTFADTTVGCAVGDVASGDTYEIHATFHAQLADASDVAYLRFGNTAESLDIDSAQATVQFDAADNGVTYSMSTIWTAGANYTGLTIALRARVKTSGDSLNLNKPANMWARKVPAP